MAIRNIRINEDQILRKKTKEVDSINERINILLDDMADTMYKFNGIGLAAPQIGILKRIFIIDIGDGLIEFINPKIISQKGEQKKIEGCLSLPDLLGEVIRPEKIKIEALNRNGEIFTIVGEELMARVLSHEFDHLLGTLFKDKAIRFVDDYED